MKSFLLDHKVAICLNGKCNKLKEVRTGVPQGSCTSPILAAYFTAPLGDVMREGVKAMIQLHPELSNTFNPDQNSLAPLTLYINDSSIAASPYDHTTTTKITE